MEVRLRHADGSWRHVETVANNLLHDPNVRGVVQTVRDVTARREAEAALRASEARFRALVQNSSDLITTFAADGTVRYVSPAIERLLGYRPQDIEGADLRAFVHPDDYDQVAAMHAMRRKLPGIATTHVNRWRHRDGSWRFIESTGTNLLHDPAVGGIVVNSRDVTERVLMERQLAQQAEELRELSHTDELTGLANRRSFLARAAQELAAARHAGQVAALLFADLDGLKAINDEYGHEAGDEALIAAADALRETFRSSDVVARVGGDEFAVLARTTSPDEAAALVRRLQRAVEARTATGRRPFRLAFSAGLALAGRLSGGTIEDLLAQADQQMYAHKRAKNAARAAARPGHSLLSA
jgi:diguanylate cyclase (GGDEF)-like protein/PAS domain S-box-containing protein